MEYWERFEVTEMCNDKPNFSIGDGTLRMACPFEYEDMELLQKQFCCVPISLTPNTMFSICNCFAANTILFILYTVNSFPKLPTIM
jgi:hypothetical protein